MLDVISMVYSLPRSVPDPADLEPEHLAVIRLCRNPASVADLASALDLPLGVIRILLADLRDCGLVGSAGRAASQVPHGPGLFVGIEGADQAGGYVAAPGGAGLAHWITS